MSGSSIENLNGLANSPVALPAVRARPFRIHSDLTISPAQTLVPNAVVARAKAIPAETAREREMVRRLSVPTMWLGGVGVALFGLWVLGWVR